MANKIDYSELVNVDAFRDAIKKLAQFRATPEWTEEQENARIDELIDQQFSEGNG